MASILPRSQCVKMGYLPRVHPLDPSLGQQHPSAFATKTPAQTGATGSVPSHQHSPGNRANCRQVMSAPSPRTAIGRATGAQTVVAETCRQRSVQTWHRVNGQQRTGITAKATVRVGGGKVWALAEWASQVRAIRHRTEQGMSARPEKVCRKVFIGSGEPIRMQNTTTGQFSGRLARLKPKSVMKRRFCVQFNRLPLMFRL